MKKLLLVGLLAVSLGTFAEDTLTVADVANASDEQLQQQIDSITAQAKARQDSYKQDVERLKKERAALAKINLNNITKIEILNEKSISIFYVDGTREKLEFKDVFSRDNFLKKFPLLS